MLSKDRFKNPWFVLEWKILQAIKSMFNDWIELVKHQKINVKSIKSMLHNVMKIYTPKNPYFVAGIEIDTPYKIHFSGWNRNW